MLVGSTAGLTGSVTNPRVAHTVTKGGVVALTKQLAAEGAAYGIRANCVSPGMIETPATRADLLAEDSPMRGIARSIPLGPSDGPRRSPAAPSSWRATRRRTSRAPTWSSTAAGPPYFLGDGSSVCTPTG